MREEGEQISSIVETYKNAEVKRGAPGKQRSGQT
jgi:hypothetical protein